MRGGGAQNVTSELTVPPPPRTLKRRSGAAKPPCRGFVGLIHSGQEYAGLVDPGTPVSARS